MDILKFCFNDNLFLFCWYKIVLNEKKKKKELKTLFVFKVKIMIKMLPNTQQVQTLKDSSEDRDVIYAQLNA